MMFIMVVSQASDPPLACRGLRAKSRVCRVQQRPRDTMRRAEIWDWWVANMWDTLKNISLSLIVVTPEKDRTVKSTQNNGNWLFYLFWGFLIVFFWVSRVVLVGHSEVTSQMWKFCGWKSCQMLVQLLLLCYKMEEYTETNMGVSENSVPLNPMVLLIIIPIKWLFHWEYTLFSDKLI